MNVQTKFNNSDRPLSSEHAVVTHFTYELTKLLSNIQFDLEVHVFNDLKTRDTALDLLVWVKNTDQVAIEFKFPKATKGGGSDQTKNRAGFNKDIMRLNYLVSNTKNHIKKGYFFAATNQNTYLNPCKGDLDLNLQVHHGHQLTTKPDNALLVEYPPLLHPVGFDWSNIHHSNGEYQCKGRFAWLMVKI